MDNQSYTWTDNPTVSGISPCNTDVLNECLMHLKYNSQNGDGFRLFDIKITDRKLIGEEAIGWVIQGGLVTMVYPDAVNQIIEEFDEGVPVTYREISCVQSLTGHYIADISQKEVIDQLFSQTGVADFYILDKTNQQFYLPRNNWFMQLTTDDTKLNQFNEAGLPNITGEVGENIHTGANRSNGAFYGTSNSTFGTNSGGGIRSNIYMDASRSSAVYGKSSTVQPASANKLLYYKVGEVSTSPNQILIDAEEFLADSVQELEDTAQESLDAVETAKNEGISAISNVSNALKQNQITDCILEAPQNIKLEFENNILTLRSGSVVVVPYGTSAPTMEIGDTLNGGEIVDISWDNEKLFYHIKYNSDISAATLGTDSSDLYLFVDSNGAFCGESTDKIYAQELQPEDLQASAVVWYDTSSNFIKMTSNAGTDWTQGYSTGLGIITRTTSGQITGISSIFQTMGFMSDLIWIGKGLKVLIPNGRNIDGTFNNIEYTAAFDLIFSDFDIPQNPCDVFLALEDGSISILVNTSAQVNSGTLKQRPETLQNATGYMYFANDVNRYYLTSGSTTANWESISCVHVGKMNTGITLNTTGSINTLRLTDAFHIAKVQDIAHLSMPSGKVIQLATPATGYHGYHAPADGYAVLTAQSSSSASTADWLWIALETPGGVTLTSFTNKTGAQMGVYLPVAKGAYFATNIATKIINRNLYFVYAEGVTND